MFETDRDPYAAIMEEDMYQEDGIFQVYLGEDSIIRRVASYDQSGPIHFFARKNPLGSEEKVREEFGEGFGESLYTAVENQMDDPVDKTVLVADRKSVTVEADPVYTSLAILSTFKGQLDETYLNEADNAVRRYMEQVREEEISNL